MAVSARGIRTSLDRNNRPVHVLRRCALGFDIHETTAREVTAVKRSARRAGRCWITGHRYFWGLEPEGAEALRAKAPTRRCGSLATPLLYTATLVTSDA
jgi:hypothetical protein